MNISRLLQMAFKCRMFLFVSSGLLLISCGGGGCGGGQESSSYSISGNHTGAASKSFLQGLYNNHIASFRSLSEGGAS